jgi:hypothetical protein
MMKLATILAAGMLAAGAAQAQDALVTQADSALLNSLVNELGHTVLDESEHEGAPVVTAETEFGMTYLLAATACEDGVCRGLMSAAVEPAETPDMARLNQANAGWNAVSVYYDEGAVLVSRYDILDYGMTRNNLRESVLVTLSVAPALLDWLLGSGEDG